MWRAMSRASPPSPSPSIRLCRRPPGVALTSDTGSSGSDHITNNPALTLTNIESGSQGRVLARRRHHLVDQRADGSPAGAGRQHRLMCGRPMWPATFLGSPPSPLPSIPCRRPLRSPPRLPATILSTPPRPQPALPSTAPPAGLPTGRRQRLCSSTAPTPCSTPIPRSSAAMPGPSPSRRRRRKRWPMAAIRSKPMCPMWPATRRAKRARR